MRSLLLFLTLLISSVSAYSQGREMAKIYLYNPYGDELRAATAPDQSTPIVLFTSGRRSGYALIETDMDSLGLIDAAGQTVYLLTEPGQSYYYGFDFPSLTYRDLSANAFWLSVATRGRYRRHYRVTRQGGVVKLD